MRLRIWHNTNGEADEYFVYDSVTHYVLFGIPKFIGRVLKHGYHKEGEHK